MVCSKQQEQGVIRRGLAVISDVDINELYSTLKSPMRSDHIKMSDATRDLRHPPSRGKTKLMVSTIGASMHTGTDFACTVEAFAKERARRIYLVLSIIIQCMYG
jgi:hypothetical protein